MGCRLEFKTKQKMRKLKIKPVPKRKSIKRRRTQRFNQVYPRWRRWRKQRVGRAQPQLSDPWWQKERREGEQNDFLYTHTHTCIHPPTRPGYSTLAGYFHIESQVDLLSVRKRLLPASCDRSKGIYVLNEFTENIFCVIVARRSRVTGINAQENLITVGTEMKTGPPWRDEPGIERSFTSHNGETSGSVQDLKM